MKQFLTIAEAAKELGVSQAYVRQLISGIQRNTPDRYYISDVFQGGKRAVRLAALMDYAAYRDRLDGKVKCPVAIPPYEPIAREIELGITQQAVIQKGETEMVAKAVVSELMRILWGAYGN